MYSGAGIYTLSQAARLIHAPAQTISRWIFGYTYSKLVDGERQHHFSDSLWQPEYELGEFSEKVLGFRDLLELRVVREFVNHGVPLLVVRRCLEAAKAMYDTPYPMTAHRFATDGRTIFLQVLSEGEDREMVDLRQRQLVFGDIIKPSLYRGIEYEDGYARRWYPEAGRRKNIVLDPSQQFGTPIVADGGVPTEAIFSNYCAEGGDKAAIGVVARIFDLQVKAVEAAVSFESKLRLAA
ncbi:MAG: DUF433 domain-containing protein [Burkholderiaceae bacterium]|nr:DUF433 domain-containing protein [Burkholderiaceae bacterium]